MIELDGVSKYYGRKGARPAALSDVSLSVPAGAVWAVVGPNGAGKSTLLSLLLGFIRASAGTVKLDGERPRDFLRDHGAAYLPEQFRLPPSWRVRDALHLFTRLEAAPDAADGALAQFGLESHADRRVGELSRGLLQRLGLAQALAVPHALVVLDEPTEGLDPVWRIRLRDVVAAMRADGRTVIIASHDLAEIERMADRAVLLERGAIREVIDIAGDVAGAAFDITLDVACDRMTEAFPAAAALDQLRYRVQVANATELTDRLGALFAMGGIVSSVQPAREPLEDRVRAALEHDA
ncbi:ABC transporter ATP-binding protein [soil metagenome]